MLYLHGLWVPLHKGITGVTSVNDGTPQASLVSELGGFIEFPEGYLKELRSALGWIRPSIFTPSKAIPSPTEVACPQQDNIWAFGRATHQGFGIGVSFLVQENLGDFVMATVGGHVQGGQVVVGDVIHGHVMLEEELDTVQMVPLRGHVQWGQPILEHTQNQSLSCCLLIKNVPDTKYSTDMNKSKTLVFHTEIV